MNRRELTNEKDWVIVKDGKVFNYNSWNDAVVVNQLMRGNLMSKQYYESHYKNEI